MRQPGGHQAHGTSGHVRIDSGDFEHRLILRLADVRVLCLIADSRDARRSTRPSRRRATRRSHRSGAAPSKQPTTSTTRKPSRLFDQALARDPNDSATHRARAVATWLHIVFMRGSITVDQYMGGMAPKDVIAREAFGSGRRDLPSARRTKRSRLPKPACVRNRRTFRPSTTLGAALGILASYTATVEGRVGGAFSQARRALNAHERVMKLDARRKDAALVVGTYRYIVSTLPFPLRWMAYVAGFGGDREYGVRLVEDAARYPSDAQTDAKVALLLLYNREGASRTRSRSPTT